MAAVSGCYCIAPPLWSYGFSSTPCDILVRNCMPLCTTPCLVFSTVLSSLTVLDVQIVTPWAWFTETFSTCKNHLACVKLITQPIMGLVMVLRMLRVLGNQAPCDVFGGNSGQSCKSAWCPHVIVCFLWKHFCIFFFSSQIHYFTLHSTKYYWNDKMQNFEVLQ